MRSLAPRIVLPSRIAVRDLREKRDEGDEMRSTLLASRASRGRPARAYSRPFSFR